MDFVAIFLSLLAVAAFSVLAYSGGGKGTDVVIEVSGTQWIYPLGEDRVERVPGPLGTTEVVIEGGKVHVRDSPCRDKLCVRAGSISTAGQWIACLPNKVMVRIGGKGGEKVDGISF